MLTHEQLVKIDDAISHASFGTYLSRSAVQQKFKHFKHFRVSDHKMAPTSLSITIIEVCFTQEEHSGKERQTNLFVLTSSLMIAGSIRTINFYAKPASFLYSSSTSVMICMSDSKVSGNNGPKENLKYPIYGET
mmetsp:Transcript_58142/g.92423  ORF Transcript_58142/g.92423 Transcript_58142/m.92423 type:complete len:134 (+) Transcript_58142:198-599(+)